MNITPNKTGRGMVSGRMFNELVDAAEMNHARGMGSRTTRGFFPRKSRGESAGLLFSGVAYVAGVKFSGLNATGAEWVKVDIAAGTAVEDAGPPPNPFPDGVEYYEKAQTAGDIHVTRFG